jgi:hypothetical protein
MAHAVRVKRKLVGKLGAEGHAVGRKPSVSYYIPICLRDFLSYSALGRRGGGEERNVYRLPFRLDDSVAKPRLE